MASRGVDRSRIGLIFAKEPPRQEIRTGIIANPVFAIPAGAANHEVEAEATFSEDVRIWTMHPHMHLRGKDMTYTATYPDGRSEIVLKVPKFDFGWQTDYWLAEPITLPKGSKLHVRAHFDNSPANRANPDPTKVVRWGDQTWEEMMIGFFTYTVEGQPATFIAADSSGKGELHPRGYLLRYTQTRRSEYPSRDQCEGRKRRWCRWRWQGDSRLPCR